MRYDETTLTKWTEKLSQTEDERAKNARNMIYDAIQSSKELNKYDIDVFTQGSYANNTNVRSDSDIDICIMCKDVFNLILPEGKTIEDYGFEESNYSFLEYRNQIKRALQNKFGIESVTDGNKSIKIKENTYHVKADVVPSFQFRNYYYENSFEPNRYIEGVWFQANTGEVVINYPKRHKDNGTDKNKESNYLYKKLVRIMKHKEDQEGHS